MAAYQLHTPVRLSPLLWCPSLGPHGPLGPCPFLARPAPFLTRGVGRGPSKENRLGQPRTSV